MYRQALAIFERAFGPHSHELAVVFNNLAAIAQARRESAEAERLYRRALAIKEQRLGPAHPDVGVTLNNLAVLYKSQGMYAQAAPLYRQALAIFEAALGPAHPNVVAAARTTRSLCARWSEYELLHGAEAMAIIPGLGADAELDTIV